MDDEQRLLGPPDPAWARRIAKIEKKFVKAEKRQAAFTGPRQARRGTRAAFAAGAAILLILALAAIARPFGTRPAVAGDPFAGTPAATWRTGEVGVVMPPATAFGSYSTEQVRSGLDQARRYILTARTDRSVLVDHRLQALEALLDPRQVAADSGAGPRSYLSPTLLAPGFTLAAEPRVDGAVTVAQVEPTGDAPVRHLVVNANLVWAYPMVPHADTRSGAGTLALLHEHLTLDVIPAAQGSATLRIESEDRYESNIDCGYLAQGLLALPRVNDPSASPTTSGTVPTGTQVFDPGTPLTRGKTCL